MEASKALIDYSKKHRYACGARHTEDLTKLKKKGENRCDLQEIAIFFQKERRGDGSAVLDSSPEIVRPGGHSEEKEPN